MFTVRTTYVLNRAQSDTDGINTFPINQYDLSGEYGSSLQDTRHRLTIVGNINALPWGIRLSPFITAYSGRPFNITLGQDLNRDTLYTERPTFAQLAAGCALRNVQEDFCDVSGHDPNEVIPRNYGRGPGFMTVNLRVSKAFGFGPEVTTPAAGRGGRGGRGGGRRGGGAAAAGDEGTRRRYNLTLSANIQNLFNLTNEGVPIGNLNSRLFGRSISNAGGFGRGGGGGQTAGNRRIDLQLRFNF